MAKILHYSRSGNYFVRMIPQSHWKKDFEGLKESQNTPVGSGTFRYVSSILVFFTRYFCTPSNLRPSTFDYSNQTEVADVNDTKVCC